MHGSTHTLAHRAYSRQRRHTCRSRHERPSSDCEHACTTCVAQRGATRTVRRRPYKSDFLHDLYRQKLVKDTSQTTHSHTQYHPGFRAVDTLPVLCKAWGWGTQKDPPCDEWDNPDCASVVRKWYGSAPPSQCTMYGPVCEAQWEHFRMRMRARGCVRSGHGHFISEACEHAR